MSHEKPWLDETLAGYVTPQQVRLMAAAPALARALARCEDQWDESGYRYCCNAHTAGAHTPHCSLDAALTAAGLDTAEKRDEARAWKGKR